MGKMGEARKYLADLPAVTIDQRVQVRQAEAQLLRDANDFTGAYAVLEQALKEHPDTPDLLYDAAMVAEKLDRMDDAEARLRRVVELKPDDAQALNALGYTLVDRTTRTQEGLVLIEKAHKLAPDDPFILDSMGWAMFRLGRYAEAETYLRRAMKERPDAEIAAHLGEVLWAKGERERAQEVWQSQLKTTRTTRCCSRRSAASRADSRAGGAAFALRRRAARCARRPRARCWRSRADARRSRPFRRRWPSRPTPRSTSPAAFPRGAAAKRSRPTSRGRTRRATTASTCRRRLGRSSRGSRATRPACASSGRARRRVAYPDWGALTQAVFGVAIPGAGTVVVDPAARRASGAAYAVERDASGRPRVLRAAGLGDRVRVCRSECEQARTRRRVRSGS